MESIRCKFTCVYYLTLLVQILQPFQHLLYYFLDKHDGQPFVIAFYDQFQQVAAQHLNGRIDELKLSILIKTSKTMHI